MTVPEQVLTAVQEASREKKITCTGAREIAARLGVEVRLVGEACDQLGVKIMACELGCF